MIKVSCLSVSELSVNLGVDVGKNRIVLRPGRESVNGRRLGTGKNPDSHLEIALKRHAASAFLLAGHDLSISDDYASTHSLVDFVGLWFGSFEHERGRAIISCFQDLSHAYYKPQ